MPQGWPGVAPGEWRMPAPLQGAASPSPPVVLLHVVRPIEKGEELTIGYTDLLRPRDVRQSDLRFRFLFDCACDRCSTPVASAADRHLSAVGRCGAATCNGWMIQKEIKKKGEFSDYICEVCGTEVSCACQDALAQEMAERVSLAAESLASPGTSIRQTYESLVRGLLEAWDGTLIADISGGDHCQCQAVVESYSYDDCNGGYQKSKDMSTSKDIKQWDPARMLKVAHTARRGQGLLKGRVKVASGHGHTEEACHPAEGFDLPLEGAGGGCGADSSERSWLSFMPSLPDLLRVCMAEDEERNVLIKERTMEEPRCTLNKSEGEVKLFNAMEGQCDVPGRSVREQGKESETRSGGTVMGELRCSADRSKGELRCSPERFEGVKYSNSLEDRRHVDGGPMREHGELFGRRVSPLFKVGRGDGRCGEVQVEGARVKGGCTRGWGMEWRGMNPCHHVCLDALLVLASLCRMLAVESAPAEEKSELGKDRADDEGTDSVSWLRTGEGYELLLWCGLRELVGNGETGATIMLDEYRARAESIMGD